jgi:hypothetical protein
MFPQKTSPRFGLFTPKSRLCNQKTWRTPREYKAHREHQCNTSVSTVRLSANKMCYHAIKAMLGRSNVSDTRSLDLGRLRFSTSSQSNIEKFFRG